MNIKVSVVGLLLFFPGCDAQQNATNSAPAPATTARTVVPSSETLPCSPTLEMRLFSGILRERGEVSDRSGLSV